MLRSDEVYQHDVNVTFEVSNEGGKRGKARGANLEYAAGEERADRHHPPPTAHGPWTSRTGGHRLT